MKRLYTRSLVAAAFATLLAGSGFARAAAELPPVHKSGTVEYISGGVGSEQAHAIEKAGTQWPLTLVFAEKDVKRGEFVTNVKAVVRDAKGQPVLSVDQAGPILLARLEPGAYVIDATLAGKTLQEKVQVKAGTPTKVELLWPKGTAH